jgi:hypothetical protein
MQDFDAKKTSERFIYSVGFSKYLTGGVTITSCDATVAVSDYSDAADPSPMSMIDSAVGLNSTAMVIKGVPVASGAAVTVALKGGIVNCTYVVSFIATLSTGEIAYEEVKLPVRKNVPTS